MAVNDDALVTPVMGDGHQSPRVKSGASAPAAYGQYGAGPDPEFATQSLNAELQDKGFLLTSTEDIINWVPMVAATTTTATRSCAAVIGSCRLMSMCPAARPRRRRCCMVSSSCSEKSAAPGRLCAKTRACAGSGQAKGRCAKGAGQ